MGKTWCISDIHGCFDEFMELLDKIGFSDDDELWLLGDYADRGFQSADVLKWCCAAPKNVHFLLGNHDDMMCCVLRRDPKQMSFRMSDAWSWNGGRDTVYSLWDDTDDEWRRDVLVPWLSNLPTHAVVEDFNGKEWMLVHGGFNPMKWDDSVRFWSDGVDDPTARHEYVEVGHGFGSQYEQDMIWARPGWLDYDGDAPLPTVHGHTPTIFFGNRASSLFDLADLEIEGEPGYVVKIRNRYDIDCGCAYHGRLAAFCLETGETEYIERIPREWDED